MIYYLIPVRVAIIQKTRNSKFPVSPVVGLHTSTAKNNNNKKQKNPSVGEDVEKSEPLCIVDGNVNWCSYYGKQYGSSLKN